MESDSRLERLHAQVAMLPLSPGVYQFLNAKDEIIYVGKAKSLRKRVSSYFVRNRDHTPKVRALVAKIENIRHIVVDSETDALLLENSLIKTLQPRYNILLKDDKTYPWIVVTRERFPRILSTRRVVRDGSLYFGPYSSVSMQRSILEFIRDVLPLRTCRLSLDEASVARGKYDVCLQYHIGNCKAPCVGAQSEREYGALVDMAVAVLKGDLRPVRAYLEEEMSRAAAALKFERAQRFKQRLEALENYRSRSVIVSARIVDTDVFSLLTEDDTVYCNHICIRGGSVVGVQTVRIVAGAEDDCRTMISTGMQYFAENSAQPFSSEIIVSHLPSAALFPGAVFTVPKRGEKLALLEFSLKSARIYRAEQLKAAEIKNPERATERLMENMRRELRLERQPRHIECFDNSNLQGTNPVASCVVFRDGRPSRKEYRHFNIKTVVGADDFASMREIVRRRYSRLLEENAELPDLIVVDGGKGQLSSAYGVLCELGLENRVPIVGLAKRIEEVFYPGDPDPYYLSRTGEPLKVICHLRDEAHRFGITFHRRKRSNAFLHSRLESIDGVGRKSIDALLRRFRSMAGIERASEAEIAETVGAARAKKIVSALHDADTTQS